MKSKLSFVLLVLCALLTLTACQTTHTLDPAPVEPPLEVSEPETPAPEPEVPAEPAAAPTLSQREREMVEDIEYLRETYKEKHIEPFLLCSEEEFDFKLDQVKAKVSELSDEDFYYELQAVIAGMGDGHTYITPSKELSAKLNNRQFPVELQSIGDRLYLYRYLDGYEQFAPYLLQEVVSINGIDVTYLEGKAESALSPFNHWLGKEYWGWMFTAPSFLDWAGCDYKEGYTFQILNNNQEVESIAVPIITSAEAGEHTWVYPENWDGIFFGTRTDWAEYVEGENDSCIYLHYSNLRSLPGIVKSFDKASTLIEEHPECRKLVIDMRDHPGGDEHTLRQVRDSVKWLVSPTIEQTYVVTGGTTASAAIISLGIFQDIIEDLVVIGEPTGQFDPFLWGINSTCNYVLPNTLHWGQISRGWYDAETDTEVYRDEDGKLYDWENTILPDVYIHQDIEDVRQGKDSVIEWVLAQKENIK